MVATIWSGLRGFWSARTGRRSLGVKGTRAVTFTLVGFAVFKHGAVDSPLTVLGRVGGLSPRQLGGNITYSLITPF